MTRIPGRRGIRSRSGVSPSRRASDASSWLLDADCRRNTFLRSSIRGLEAWDQELVMSLEGDKILPRLRAPFLDLLEILRRVEVRERSRRHPRRLPPVRAHDLARSHVAPNGEQ